MRTSLIESAAKPPDGVYDLYLPTHVFGVLQQVRTKITRDSLEDLMASINAIGQQAAGIVIGLSAGEARKYLTEVNDLWGTEYKLEQFDPVHFQELDASFYLFLVAGHRRLAAVKELKLNRYLCRLHLHVEFVDAFSMQFHENVHKEVPLDDEARFLTFMWRKQKSMNETLSLTEFAKKHGKSTDAIRRANRFTSLPISVQKLVLPSKDYKRGIAFGILCEMARLQEARQVANKAYNEQELIHLAYVLVAQQKTEKTTAGWVTAQIRELQGQGIMFNLSLQDEANNARRTVTSGLEQTLRTGEEHLRRVARLHSDGGIRRVASGSAVRTVERVLKTATDHASEIVEGIRGGRHAPEARKAVLKVVDASK